MRGLAVAAVVCSCVLGTLAHPSAAAAATCTAEQKAARTQALANFQQSAASARRSYFKRHRSAKLRAAFVRSQQRKLKALRSAAACTVPPLPPSSGQSCSFMLAPNAENARRGRTETGPLFNEGPLDSDAVLAATGRVEAAMIFVDFPDVPGSESPATIGPLHTAELRYFEEVSYGRFSLTVTPIERWFRMPGAASSYDPLAFHQLRFVREAITVADPAVDFSRYRFVFIVSARGAVLGNRPTAHYSGFGVRVDGTEIRFAAMFDPGLRAPFGRGTSFVANHELAHTLGLPDLGGVVNGWDPMGPSPGQLWPSGAHFLGWHKWKLGWLDPPQLTCQRTAGFVEETITPIAVAGGKKLVVVPVSDSLAYVVEARRYIGYDRNACGEGVLVYTVDSQRGNSEGAVVVKGPPACGTASPGALQTGRVHEDAHVKVEVLASDGRDYRVRVTRK
jgi:M6 family metalloprotease-like protein